MFFGYVLQRVCLWLVALAMTKLVKENEPLGKSAGFSVVANHRVKYMNFQ